MQKSNMFTTEKKVFCIIQVDKNAVDRKWPAVYGNVLLPYVIHPQLGQLETS